MYFKKFLEITEDSANAEMRSKAQLIEECQIITKNPGTLKNNHSKTKPKKSKTTKRHSCELEQCRPTLNNHNTDVSFQPQLTFKGEKNGRKRMRCRLLNDIYLCEQNEAKYVSLIEQLIDLEESFLE